MIYVVQTGLGPVEHEGGDYFVSPEGNLFILPEGAEDGVNYTPRAVATYKRVEWDSVSIKREGAE